MNKTFANSELTDAKTYGGKVSVPPAGRSHLACKSCGTHLTRYREKVFLLEADKTPWECICGEIMKVQSIEAHVSIKDSSLLEDPSSAVGRIWYHATYQNDWANYGKKKLDPEFETVPYLHLGSKSGAMHRGKDAYGDIGMVGNYSFYLYKVELDSDFNVGAEVFVDSFAGNEMIEGKFDSGGNPLIGLDGSKIDGVLYVNRYESPGSISMLTDISRFRIVSRSKIVRKNPAG